MATIPKKAKDRFARGVTKFQRVLKHAKDRDVNESDTVSIVKDMLAEVFGYDKYTEVTSEVAIRGTYCDLAVKTSEEIQFLIEVKAVGLTLKDNHLRQAVDYGSRHGVRWVVLTNGVDWDLYRLRFQKPIKYEQVAAFSFLDLGGRKAEDQERLFLLSKEGLDKSVRDEYYERVQCVNKYVAAAITVSEPVLAVIRREMRKVSPGLMIRVEEVESILRTEVLKRDALEGEEAKEAATLVKKAVRKKARHSKAKTTVETVELSTPVADTEGVDSDQD